MIQTSVSTFDRVATRTRSSGPLLQRKCGCGKHTPGGGTCNECQAKDRQQLQRSAMVGRELGTAPQIVHQVLASPGRPLDTATRAFMEPAFGRDFGRIRVHSDSLASESAAAVHAQAYTVGSHLVFGVGKYNMQDSAGRRLLAHELTHAVQQGDSGPIPRRLKVGSPDSIAEQQADKVASSIDPNAYAPVNRSSDPPQVQRQVIDCERYSAIILDNPCPIGEVNDAPELIKVPGIESGSCCRGACGADCHEKSCEGVDDIEKQVGSDVCVYQNVIKCGSHEGCVKHDECYDKCATSAGERGFLATLGQSVSFGLIGGVLGAAAGALGGALAGGVIGAFGGPATAFTGAATGAVAGGALGALAGGVAGAVAPCRRECDSECNEKYDHCLKWAIGEGPQPNKIKFSDPPFVRRVGDFPSQTGTENLA